MYFTYFPRTTFRNQCYWFANILLRKAEFLSYLPKTCIYILALSLLVWLFTVFFFLECFRLCCSCMSLLHRTPCKEPAAKGLTSKSLRLLELSRRRCPNIREQAKSVWYFAMQINILLYLHYAVINVYLQPTPDIATHVFTRQPIYREESVYDRHKNDI